MMIPNLPPLLAEALVARGYSSLTPVQSAVLDPQADGRDLVVSARTGSGKTAWRPSCSRMAGCRLPRCRSL
jgi:ATP-dependent RNA helicase DeaD